MPFFIRNKKSTKRKGSASEPRNKSGSKAPVNKKKKVVADDEILSESDIDSADEKRHVEESSSSEEEETAQEKRLRLAKEYIAQIEADEAEKKDDQDIDRDVISHRIKQDLLEQSGKLHKFVATEYTEPSPDDIRLLRGHQLPITCLVIDSSDKYIYSGAKDCSLIKWDISTGVKVKTIHGGRKGTENKHIGHTDQIMCIAISTDNKFLVTGDKNKLIYVWNPETLEKLHKFSGHRDTVSGLAFRKHSHQLFSASHDRTVKIWNLDEMAYVETLFGHQDQITGIDSLMKERAITSGARDGSIRIWKVIEESQLVFNGPAGSIDCLCLINEDTFLTGSDDNCLALWKTVKKKPMATVQNAHSGSCNADSTGENWITAVAARHNTDIVASGSKDGCVRFWQCGNDFKSLTPLFTVPVTGFVNSLQFSSDGSFVVAGIGQEHKMGRWWRIKAAKNAVCIIPLPKTSNG